MLTLSLPVLVRIDTTNIDTAIAQIVNELTPSGGGFNYLDATVIVKYAHKGIHRLEQLLASPRLLDGSVGARANRDVATMACPVAFGRSTKVIDLSPRQFQFGVGRSAPYRVPFFFLEDGKVKLYFLQPRKNTIFTLEAYSLFASIVKRHLLDSEFYGEKTDIEIVDVAEVVPGKGRQLRTYSLGDLEIWDESRVQAHLSAVIEALNIVESEKMIVKQRRPLRNKELPLFA